MKNKTEKNDRLLRLLYSAVCLALALLLPLLTGQVQQIGNMLCLMHIPVLLCGFLCGWQWGMAVGFIAPLLRFAIFGMPPIYPIGAAMAVELATYGALSGLLYHLLPKKKLSIYAALMAAMLGGRLAWGAARYAFAGLSGSEFPFSAFIAGAVTNALPGIARQIIHLPLLVMALQQAGRLLNAPRRRSSDR